jgi:hypothetical protein
MGRIFSLMFSLFGVFVTSAALTWWLNTIAIRLFLRWVERYGVVRRGSLKACIGILLGIWAAFSIVTAAIVLVVFLLLRSMLRDWLATTLPKPLFNAGYVVIIVCIILAVVSGVVAGFSEVRGAIGAARRRRFLFDPGSASPQPPIQNVDIPMQTGPGRRIVILCDGTSNRPDNHPEGVAVFTIPTPADQRTAWSSPTRTRLHTPRDHPITKSPPPHLSTSNRRSDSIPFSK